MARGRGRSRTRTRSSTRSGRSTSANEDISAADVSMEDSAVEEENEISTNEASVDNEVSASKDKEVDSNAEDESDQAKANEDSEPKKRGRKRKAEIPQEERYKPTTDPAKRGIMAQGGSLRRRDTLKSTSRYSPPPTITRVRGTNRSFPSTSQSKYVIDADADNANSSPKIDAPAPSVNRRKSLGFRNVNNTVSTVENLEVSKSDDDKVVVTLPDGSLKKVPVPYKKSPLETEESETTTIKELVNDPEYKPASRSSRRKSDTANQVQTVALSISTSSVTNTTSETVTIDSKTPKVSNLTTVKLTSSSTPIHAVTKASNIAQVSVSQINKTPIISTTLKGNLPAILKPSMTSTPIANTIAMKSTARRPPPLTKYLDALPEVAECMNNDGIDDSNMKKLPDKIMLIHSELPLDLAVYIDNSESDYLFRQIISPVQSTRYVCLLCKGIDVNFGTKEEKDILLHYQSLHELDVEIGHAKFSEDIVFICLPKMVLSQLETSTSLHLNSTCQYCEERLNDIDSMKQHYASNHNKEVILMEQEQIMKMHHFFYCSKCTTAFNDFEAHHKHMKTEHGLRTYKCKSCVLVTQDENRLRTHYKAKHMLHTSGQNYQCYYCHGLLIGVERLLKHIQQSHMVQTGSDFSCIACLQTVGRGKELLNHAQNCSLAGIKPEQKDHKFGPLEQYLEPLAEGEVECYFCNVRLESEEIYKLHLHHEHMKWIGEPVKGTPEDTKLLTVEDVISDEDLNKAKIKTFVGHWCRMCDQMVKVYQLFYLHMANYHRLQKEFQCIITSCKAQFIDVEEFKKHVEDTGHCQKTVISHPDEVFVCTYCDIYFPTEEDLINHLITDQHINKFTASGHFHRTEPRNFKCKACHTFFGMKESYIHHLETEAHKYVCHYCGITTATPSARRAHVQNTHPEKLLTCEECSEPHSDMLAHFVNHGFTFECKKCVKKFYNRERLNAHMEVHQDPIECTWEGCGRMIATRSMLVTHYRGHKSEHKCQICGQAFWNFSMLTSHLRSHQPIPRSQPTNKSLNNKIVTYSNIRNNPRPTLLNQRTTKINNNSQSLIKCGHCSLFFTTTKELSVHKCDGKIPSTSNGGNKLNDLASIAMNEQPKSYSKQTAPKRKASPKKVKEIDTQQRQNEQQSDQEETQLIMILNQVTGELMEITAPKGMEVKDVIESLNFQSMDDVSTVVDPSMEDQLIVQEKNENNEQEETAAAIEMIEQQANDVDQEASITEQQHLEEEQNDLEGVETEDGTPMIIEHQEEGKEGDEGQIAQILAASGDQNEQAIILPAGCFNEDGSLTLDAATLSRLNLAISVDDNGQITSDPNTTFIIDPSATE